MEQDNNPEIEAEDSKKNRVEIITEYTHEVAPFKEDFSLFLEAGFIAIKQNDAVGAARLFDAAQALSPMNTAPIIGRAYIQLSALNVAKAQELYQQVVDREPENMLAQMFLGICYLLIKPKHKHEIKGLREKGKTLVREAIDKTTDPTVKDLGTITLDWSAKDLDKMDNKMQTPFSM